MIEEQKKLDNSKKTMFSPKIGLIQLIVIILGIAIIFLSSLIIFKLFRGDHKANENNNIIFSDSNYNLVLPKNEEIVNISGSQNEIFILTKSSEGQKIFIIVDFKVIKVISISLGEEITIEKLES